MYEVRYLGFSAPSRSMYNFVCKCSVAWSRVLDRTHSFRAGAPTVSFTYFLPHPLTHVCTTRHRSVVLPIVNHLLTFVLRYIFTTPIHLHLAKGFCLSVTKIARDGQAFSSRLFKLSVLCAHGPGTST